MQGWKFLWLLALVTPVRGQTVCPPTPAYSVCEVVVELNDQEAAAHPNPYLTVQLHAEFRSPRHHTYLAQAFWDGGRRMVMRVAPTDAGDWDFRITSNLARFDGKTGQVKATESQDSGFIKAANVHHWMYSEGLKPHLWMGDTCLGLASLSAADFQQYVDARAKQKFNHVRALLLGAAGKEKEAFSGPDTPDAEFFRKLDERIKALNQKGIFVDLVLGDGGGQIVSLFSGWQQRERFVRYVAARYSTFHITWEVMQEFEKTPEGRTLAKELGLLLKKNDSYGHPRSAHTIASSASLLADDWMDHVMYKSPDAALGAIEHQQYPVPFVNAEFGVEGTTPADALRHGLWKATMNGQYPVFNGTGALDSAGTKMMANWFEMFSDTRHWELEPYFDVDGARAIALPGVEYIVYVEKPAPIEVIVEKHSYDVFWINPITGERIKEKKNFNGDKFAAEPPDNQHDWVLHLSREGRKEGMLKSYKFESRPILLQEVEQNPARVPFEVTEPLADTFQITRPPKFQAKLKRDTRATRTMLYLWTGEVPTEGQGYRILGTGAEGTMQFPPNLAEGFPAVLNVRLLGLNANGKLYSIDKVYRLTQ